ncbi:MAG: transposase [Planctomycetes bacterium]|nr:transposase [Planctomycetota bacterium]
MTMAIHELMDDAKCSAMVRELRWPHGVCCPHCESDHVVKNGHDTSEVCRQRYRCRDGDRCFDDLTNTVFAGHHQPLRIWMLVEPDANEAMLDNARCTCFLENISSEPCGEAAKPWMGRKSRAFLDHWHDGPPL